MSGPQATPSLSSEVATRVAAIRKLLALVPCPSRQEIGEKLGLTKNQVCGIVARHISPPAEPLRQLDQREAGIARAVFARGGGAGEAAKLLDIEVCRFGKMLMRSGMQAPGVRSHNARSKRSAAKGLRATARAVAVGPVASTQPGHASAAESAPRALVAASALGVSHRPPLPVRAPGFGRSEGCQWLEGEVRPHRFECTAPRAASKPYCPQHAARCYERRQRIL